MPLHRQFQHLIEDLIALKDLYQTQLVDSEKKAAHFKEQLSHVNGLLVAQLVENQQFVQSLVDMRSQCQAQLEANQRQTAHAREQLNHVNALLADQVILSSIERPFELQAAALEERSQPALSGTTEPEAKAEPAAEPAAEPEVAAEPEIEPSSQLPAVAQQPQTEEMATPLEVEQKNEELIKNPSAIKTPLKAEYQHLTKIQAVEKLLQDNQGKILTVDYIVWSLYGEMDAEAVKAEKPRIYDTLGQGMDKGLWEKVPDQAACYTYRLNLVEPAPDAGSAIAQSNSRPVVSSRRRPSRRGKSDDMLPRYNHLSLTAAVEVVVNEHPGEVITTDKVAKVLYGEDIEGRALIKAKDRIGKTLWGGATQGRWQRIPGRLGCYTLNLKTLKKG